MKYHFKNYVYDSKLYQNRKEKMKLCKIKKPVKNWNETKKVNNNY